MKNKTIKLTNRPIYETTINMQHGAGLVRRGRAGSKGWR